MDTLREEIMMRADTAVRSLEAGEGHELTFRLGGDFVGFQGHFPGHPILPAFVQLLLGECSVGIRSGRAWTLRRVDRAKFLRPIQPNEPVTVAWQEQPRDGGLRCHFTLQVAAEKAAVFALELAPEEGGHA